MCEGKKKLPQARCPNSTINNVGIGIFKAYRLYKEYNSFPISGGIYEQSAQFVNTLELCDKVDYILSKEKQINADMLRKMADGPKSHNRNKY